MTPTQSSLTGTGSVAPGHDRGTIPNDSSSNVISFTHHSIKFVMDIYNKSELTEVECNDEHLIGQVLQCTQDGHLMCRKCYFPLDDVKPEICPKHRATVFVDMSTTRSIRCMPVECPANKTFKVKCPWSGEYGQVARHLDDCVFIPGSARVIMQNAMLKAVSQGAEQERKELKQAITHLRQMQRDSDNRLVAMEKLLDETTRDLMQKYEEQAKLLDRVSLKLAMPKMDATSSAATAAEDEIPPSYDGKLLWSIKDYSVKRTLTDSVYGQKYLESPVFFTSKDGYKLRMRLYPNGDGDGKGSHVSLFFQILPGEYDELLEWPFNEKVSFKILDTVNKTQRCYLLIPNSQMNSFHKPDCRPNISVGDPTIISHIELKEGGYLQGDTLHVEVNVGS